MSPKLLRVPVLAALVTGVLLASCGGKSSGGPTPPPPLSCDFPDGGLPDNVFCTGLYENQDPTQISADVMPYTPGVTLWSDGAEKHRYLQLPPSTQIDTSNMDAWKFPEGTRVWKEFKLDGGLVETRLLWKRSATKWAVGTYVWDESGKQATLNTNPKGTILANGYEIPSLKDCDKCHYGGADKVLGVEAIALALPTAEGATLSVLAQKGLLSNPPANTTIQLPEDSTGKAGAALGYLHANCGMPCHSTRGAGNDTHLVLRLRAGEFWPDGTWSADGGSPPGSHDPASYPLSATVMDPYVSMWKQKPTTGAIAQNFPNAYRVTPGSHTQSLIWMVAHIRGTYQMPPLVSHKVDDVGMQKLVDWIDALPPSP